MPRHGLKCLLLSDEYTISFVTPICPMTTENAKVHFQKHSMSLEDTFAGESLN